MLIELHTLTSHPPANLNRDDLGRPKTAFFGGAERARISSQSLKRSIRKSPYLANLLGGAISTRSRRIPEQLYNELLKELGGEHEERLRQVCEAFTGALGKPDKNPLHTKQIVFLTPGELERAQTYLRQKATSDEKLTKKALKEISDTAASAIGLDENPGDALDLALFGRMTTDEASAFKAVEAAMQVAHAISTHEVVTETDWFTAVDDVTEGRDETGSGHLNETEFNAAVFYKYFSCNLPALLENLNAETPEDAESAVAALAAFLDAACRVTPTGKQNAFASNAVADTALLVLRPSGHPVSLANAFEAPIQANGAGYLAASRHALAEHYRDLVKSYSLDDQAIYFTVSAAARDETKAKLPESVRQADSLDVVFAFLRKKAQTDAGASEEAA